MRLRGTSFSRALWVVLGIALVPAFGASASGGPDFVPLEVMTFNIRVDAGVFSWFDPNGWLYVCGPRRDRAAITIRAADPDIFGVQEALVNQVLDLKSAFPDYGFYGAGRTDGCLLGEYSGIFFRSSRFSLVDSGTFWLSETPHVPGTVFPGSATIRIASWTVLDDAAAGVRFFVLNTHWDHVSQESRERSATLVRQKIGQFAGDLPVIVMGDMNATETNAAFRELIGVNDPGGLQLVDAYRSVLPVREPDEATAHGFTGRTEGWRIDYVLPTDFFTPVVGRIDRTTFSCGWPSDHYPVLASLRVPVGPEGLNEAVLAGAEGLAPPEDPCIPDCTVPSCASVPPQAEGRAVPPVLIAAVGALAVLLLLRRRNRLAPSRC